MSTSREVSRAVLWDLLVKLRPLKKGPGCLVKELPRVKALRPSERQVRSEFEKGGLRGVGKGEYGASNQSDAAKQQAAIQSLERSLTELRRKVRDQDLQKQDLQAELREARTEQFTYKAEAKDLRVALLSVVRELDTVAPGHLASAIYSTDNCSLPDGVTALGDYLEGLELKIKQLSAEKQDTKAQSEQMARVLEEQRSNMQAMDMELGFLKSRFLVSIPHPCGEVFFPDMFAALPYPEHGHLNPRKAAESREELLAMASMMTSQAVQNVAQNLTPNGAPRPDGKVPKISTKNRSISEFGPLGREYTVLRYFFTQFDAKSVMRGVYHRAAQ
jgi:hypothetical protein